jgi:orotidine-5'-phosphate decarboxylase
MESEPYPIAVALDDMDREHAIAIAKKLSGKVWGFKLHTLFTKHGPGIIQDIKPHGKVFLDMKVHEIPPRAADHIRAHIEHGVDLTSIHSDGGSEMMKACRIAGGKRVTAVTNLSTRHVRSSAETLRKARRAYNAGIRTLIAPPRDARAIKLEYPNVTIVSPGVRGKNDPVDGHKRAMNPRDALFNGSDLLVIGGPITKSDDPVAKTHDLMQE